MGCIHEIGRGLTSACSRHRYRAALAKALDVLASLARAGSGRNRDAADAHAVRLLQFREGTLRLIVILIFFLLISISACSSQAISADPYLEASVLPTNTPHPTENPTRTQANEEVRVLPTATLAPTSIFPPLPKSRLFFETKSGINAIDIDCDTDIEQCFTDPYSISLDYRGEMEVSPDGQLIAISYVQIYSSRYIDSSIRLISISDNSVWAVGHRGTRYPVWSPDSQQIAYIDHVGSGSEYSRICFSTTSAPYRCLPTDNNAKGIGSLTWSPEGTYVAFCGYLKINAPCYLYLSDLESFSVVTISKDAGRNMVWSPEGDRLFFYQNDEETQVLMSANIKACLNSDGVCITELDQVVQTIDFEFSPDGNYVSFFASEGLGVIDANCFLDPSTCTGLPVYLTDPKIEIRDYSWSPDSLHIAYAALNESQAGIYIVDLDGAGNMLVERLEPDYAPRIDWRSQ